MTIDGYTDLHVGWGRGAEDEREGSKRWREAENCHTKGMNCLSSSYGS